MTTGLKLGAPGVYFRPKQPDTASEVIRLDETGFVGLAPRGPVQIPVRVTNWSDFVRWFGGLPHPERHDPPTLLAHAVDAFFGQGGRVAWVLRVVPPDAELATAVYESRIGDSVLQIAAANEGSWGDHLSIKLEFAADAAIRMTTAADASGATVFLRPSAGADVGLYSLLRIRHPRLIPAGELRWIVPAFDAGTGSARVARHTLDCALPLPPGERVDVAVVTGLLTVVDRGPDGQREEQLSGLGLHPGHSRFIPAVLHDESALVSAAETFGAVSPGDGLLRPMAWTLVTHGWDRWDKVTFDSFFDDLAPAEQDPADDDADHRGVDRMGRVTDIGLLCVPDLLWEWREESDQPTTPGKARTDGRFHRCCRPALVDVLLTAASQPAPQLDPTDPGDLDEIVRRQRRVVDVAKLRARFVALLDVPFGIKSIEIAKWRATFDCSFAACYHPWLAVASGTRDHGTVFVPPSAFAAGITANREVLSGVQRGPANELASDALSVSAELLESESAYLFGLSVNVFRPERDGFRLASARTLSSDPQYRQLSVRRLMTMLALSLERVGQNLVFEPGSLALRTAVRQVVVSLLRDLFRQGVFAGGTEAESFFVRCDDSLNDERTRALGQLIAEIGVAPASPLEFIAVRLIQGVDGTSVVSFGG